MLYQSLKLTNNVWVLNELKIQPGNPDVTVRFYSNFIRITAYFYPNIRPTFQFLLFSLQLSLKSRSVEVASGVFQAYNAILHS